MIRRHNDPYVSEIMEEALALLNKYRIVRHELVLTYVLWKQNKTVSVILMFMENIHQNSSHSIHITNNITTSQSKIIFLQI